MGTWFWVTSFFQILGFMRQPIKGVAQTTGPGLSARTSDYFVTPGTGNQLPQFYSGQMLKYAGLVINRQKLT